MKNFGIKSVVEFGCGLGFYTKMLADAGFDVLGVDMSQTAIEKASKNFPKLKFKVDQIENIEYYSDYDCFLLAEIVWYILPHLDLVLKKIKKFKGKYLPINLVFYRVSKYGTDYFTNLREFIDYIPFELLGYSESTTKESISIETSTVFKI